MRYVLYKGNVYFPAANIFTTKDCFVTGYKEKTDDTFYKYLDHLYSYARDFEVDDVYDLYQVDFFARFNYGNDCDEDDDCLVNINTRESVLRGKWDSNEKRLIELDHKPKIENNEIVIMVEDDWEWSARDERYCDIVVNIHDCPQFLAHYVYSVRDGKKLDEKEAVRVVMGPEEFKAEMLKHRLINI